MFVKIRPFEKTDTAQVHKIFSEGVVMYTTFQGLQYLQMLSLFCKKYGTLFCSAIVIVHITIVALLLSLCMSNYLLCSILVTAVHLIILCIWSGNALKKLYETYATDQIEKYDLKDIAGHYGAKETRQFWVAEDDQGQIVGTVAVEEYSKDSSIAELRRMSVSSRVRRAGVASKLLLELESFCKRKQFKGIILTTSSIQDAAIAMYKKRGFIHIENQYFFDWNVPAYLVQLYKELDKP